MRNAHPFERIRCLYGTYELPILCGLGVPPSMAWLNALLIVPVADVAADGAVPMRVVDLHDLANVRCSEYYVHIGLEVG